eukprot:NODE_5396_length_660_cov_17.476548_g5233_i0.p1 GENE.NODE_5396_length_660_cov_17.476548_g5233_i0~~NODE_5396_length_660_cov_17.476548_g5233_i0.p1  ORF type:complete len:180 (-),score=40.78 NODE_5396_length_660_cov_17.476548_g5233_i0:119-577(-)
MEAQLHIKPAPAGASPQPTTPPRPKPKCSNVVQKARNTMNRVLQKELLELIHDPLVLWEAFIRLDPNATGYLVTSQFRKALRSVLLPSDFYDWVMERSIKLSKLPFHPPITSTSPCLQAAASAAKAAVAMGLLSASLDHCDYKFFMNQLNMK